MSTGPADRGPTGRFLLVGRAVALDDLGAALAALGHTILRADEGAGSAALAAAQPDALLVATPPGDALLAAGLELPVAWVGGRAEAAVLGPGPAAHAVIALPLCPAEVATHAASLLARRQLLVAHAEARRLRELFIALVVHDLKNPLATVLGNAEYLGQAPELLPDSHEAVADLLASAGLLGRVVQELVDVGRGLDGPLVTSPVSIRLDRLLGELVRAARTRATRHGVTVVQEGDPGARPLIADRDLVRRLLDTLLDNAIKHAPPDTVITVRVQALPDLVRLSVSDRGRAIPPVELDRMFQRAALLDATSAGAARALRRLAALFCLLVCETHGGRIWAQNQDGGEAVVLIELPWGE